MIWITNIFLMEEISGCLLWHITQIFSHMIFWYHIQIWQSVFYHIKITAKKNDYESNTSACWVMWTRARLRRISNMTNEHGNYWRSYNSNLPCSGYGSCRLGQFDQDPRRTKSGHRFRNEPLYLYYHPLHCQRHNSVHMEIPTSYSRIYRERYCLVHNPERAILFVQRFDWHRHLWNIMKPVSKFHRNRLSNSRLMLVNLFKGRKALGRRATKRSL